MTRKVGPTYKIIDPERMPIRCSERVHSLDHLSSIFGIHGRQKSARKETMLDDHACDESSLLI